MTAFQPGDHICQTRKFFNRTVERTGEVESVDPQGRLRVWFPPDQWDTKPYCMTIWPDQRVRLVKAAVQPMLFEQVGP